MPSRKTKKRKTRRKSSKSSRRTSTRRSKSAEKAVFVPILILSLIVWVVYRLLFAFPVWFDETIGKAIFFGFPVWLYITISNNDKIADSLAVSKLKPGLLLGLAFGGVFGFAAALASLISTGGQILAVSLFSSNVFWGQFFLALMTGFWETIFFFSFVMTVIQDRMKHWSLLKQVMVVSLIFLIFHVPNTVLRFGGTEIFSQLILLFFFALGQSFIYSRNQNAYALVISHAIWGMALLVHLQ